MEYTVLFTKFGIISTFLIFSYFLLSLSAFEIVNCKKPAINKMDIVGVMWVLLVVIPILLLGCERMFDGEHFRDAMIFCVFGAFYLIYKPFFGKFKTKIFFTKKNYQPNENAAWIATIMASAIMSANFTHIAINYILLLLSTGQLIGYANLNVLKKYAFECEGNVITGYLVSENKDILVIKPDRGTVAYVKRGLLKVGMAMPNQKWGF
jgi:hypothetical protein